MARELSDAEKLAHLIEHAIVLGEQLTLHMLHKQKRSVDKKPISEPDLKISLRKIYQLLVEYGEITCTGAAWSFSRRMVISIETWKPSGEYLSAVHSNGARINFAPAWNRLDWPQYMEGSTNA